MYEFRQGQPLIVKVLRLGDQGQGSPWIAVWCNATLPHSLPFPRIPIWCLAYSAAAEAWQFHPKPPYGVPNLVVFNGHLGMGLSCYCQSQLPMWKNADQPAAKTIFWCVVLTTGLTDILIDQVSGFNDPCLCGGSNGNGKMAMITVEMQRW